jgi:hypothetical protein
LDVANTDVIFGALRKRNWSLFLTASLGWVKVLDAHAGVDGLIVDVRMELFFKGKKSKP